MKRRDLAPGDVFVFLDSPLYVEGSKVSVIRGLGAVWVAAEIDDEFRYAGHRRHPEVAGARPHPRPGLRLGQNSLDRPVMLLRLEGTRE